MSTCASCEKPLVLFIHDDAMQGSSSEPQGSTVPDDVHMTCGCHFHWQCLLDAYEVTQCPHCMRTISSHGPGGELRVLCNVYNEGGMQENLDIFLVLSEELYLKAYPDDRKPRAFLEFSREGDIEAMVDLLKADEDGDKDEDDEDDEMEESPPPLDAAAILRYQDPIGGMQSALHFAVANNKVEVVWLLLLLATTLEPEHFPREVRQAAETLGIAREDQTGKVDIRVLHDGDGKTAAQHADANFGSIFDLRLLTSP